MEQNIHLKAIENKYVDDLVYIINNDDRLLDALDSKKEKTQSDKYLYTIGQWQINTNSKTFAIVFDDVAIGTISLSHIKEDRTAKIGYWIGSKYWNKGYTTQAFAQILDLAKSLKLESITCSIKKDNIASIAIWKKFNAEFEEDYDRFYPKLKL